MNADFFSALSIGMGVWLFAYGLNRVWLLFKCLVS